MNKVKNELKRVAIAALILSLMCTFVLPVQVYAEDITDGGTVAQETNTESTTGEGSFAEIGVTDEIIQIATAGCDADALVVSDNPESVSEIVATESSEIERFESESTESECTELESTESELDETKSIEPEPTEFECTETEFDETEPIEPEPTELERIETELDETETIESEYTELNRTDTEPGEADNIESNFAGTESTELDSTEEVPIELMSSESQVAETTNEAANSVTDDNNSANAIQQAVDAAISAGQKYITIVVQDGTYTGGLVIDNSGVDEDGNAKESIVVNIIAHDAYANSDTQDTAATEPIIVGNGSATANAVYAVPTNADGTVDTTVINSDSAGGVKLEGGVSAKNVELLLAGIYLSLKEQKENQGKLESMFTDEGNVDVSVENADNFTYYGTSQNDTANITVKDVDNTTIDTGDGDDVLNLNTTTSSNVQLDTTNQDDSELISQFDAAESEDVAITISTGSGNDKITVSEKSNVTNNEKLVSVYKGQNTLVVDAGDGADTITLKGSTNLVDIKKNIDETTAQRVYAIACRSISGHGSIARIEGGSGDDQLNLDTTWELGTLGKTEVDYQGGDGNNRLHLTGTLADQDGRVSGKLSAQERSGYISLYSSNTVSRTDYRLIDTNLLINKKVTELTVKSGIPMYIQMRGVDTLTDDLTGKKSVNVTIEGGKVIAGGKEVSFQPFTDYVYDPGTAFVNLGSFSNNSAGGLLSKLIIRGQNLTVGENVAIKLPGATLMLESVNGTESGGTILIQGHLEAENVVIKLVSSDSHAISFVEQDGDMPSIMDVNTSAVVTIAPTAKLIATRIVDILAKSIQGNGLLPDLTELVPGLDTLTESEKMAKINEYVKKLFGVDSLEMLEQAASINFISIKIASAVIEILGEIIAGSVKVSTSNQVDTTVANSALRDLGLPFALSVIVGEAGIKVSDGAKITANESDIYLDAQSDIKVNTTALSGRLPFTLAVSVVDNKAYVDISGGKLISTNGNIIANANGTVNIKTSATGSNVRPNNNAVVPSTDNQASNTNTQIEMGKSGGFFAISVFNQDVFSTLRGAAEAIAKSDITVTSIAKASVVNNAASNPGEDGESMTLVKLLKTLAGDEEVESDGGIVGKVVNAIKGHYDKKKNQATSQEEKAELEKKEKKRTSALGSFLDKLTGNGEDSEGDDVGSLVDKATSSANSGKTDSTHTVQLVGALAVTYTSNNNKAYVETDGEVTAEGKLSVTANGELSVQTLADGSPVEADDPAGGEEETGPKDQHYNAHSHGVIKVDALTNGTIIMDASIGKNEDGTFQVVENGNFPKGIDAFEDFNFVVKACFGYKLEADENGKYWITNEYVRDSDNAKKNDKIEVVLIGKDAEGCYLYKSVDTGYGGVRVYNGENLFKAEFVPKQSITVENNAPQLGAVKVTDAQKNGKTLYFADQGDVVYVKVNIKSGVVNFTTPNVTYKVAGSDLAQPVNVTDIIKGDVQEDGTLDYYYSFKMPEGDVTIHVQLNGDGMNIKLDLEASADRTSDVWITDAEKEPSGDAMEKDTVFTGKVGEKIKIVIQLANNTFLVKNSLMFAGKTPVYIKDITYDGDSQYTCYVNIPAILKTEGDQNAGTDLKLTFLTTVDPKEAQGTVEDTSTALGAGLAVDVTRYNNQAYITNAKDNHVTAGSVEVKANTANLSASAVSKAGFVAGDLGVAGAITVHLVSANNEVLIGGDIRTVTLNGGTLVLDSTIQNSNIVTNAEAAGDGADGKDVDRESVGVGAGIAVGVTNLAVVSRILDIVTVGGSIDDLNINAGHSGTESMSASAGASGGTSSVPVLAMNISGVSVVADSGRMLNNVLRLTGDALVNAANSITRTITADAAAVGGGVGVGASFIIDILNDSAKAKLGRGMKTNGNITVTADSVSRLNATAKSGAQGSVSEEGGKADTDDAGSGSGGSGEEPPPSGGSDNKVTLPDDYYEGLDDLFGEGSCDNDLTEEDDPESLVPLFKEGEADAFVDSNKQSAQDLSSLVSNNNGNVNSQSVGDAFENRQKAETSEGSVQVAATMVLNIQSNTTLAQIDEVEFVEADGSVNVTSRHDTDGIIMADASATKSTTGVGVAVAINAVTYSNIAQILTDSITAKEVLVKASVYENETKETAEGFFDAIKNDVLSTKDKIMDFINSVMEASKKGDLVTFIKGYLGDRALTCSEDIENGIVQLIVQWVGELLQGKTPSFPTSEQEDKVKEQISKTAKDIFKKIKENFSVKKMKDLLFGKDGLLNTLKKKTKDISLREQAVNAAIHYLAGKLGGNEEAVGMGPRISTSAVSGAGASDVGVAGSVAISVVNGTSLAHIDQAVNGQMNTTGNITIESKASQDVYTSAGASVDALGRVEKNKDATDGANSTQGGASNTDAGKSVGVGAAVAMSFADLTSDAGIGSGWTICAKDLLMDSKAENNVETTSVSGTDPLARTEEPTDKTDKDLTEEEKIAKEKEEAEKKAAEAMDYAVDASVSVTLIQNSVKAYLAENSVIKLIGNLNMCSSQSGETNTNASGFAMGNETAVGAAVAINLAFSDVLTQILSGGTVDGSASLDSRTENQDDANALALAMGADMDRYMAKLRNSEKVMKFNKKKEEEKKEEDKKGEEGKKEEDEREDGKKDEEKSDGKIENKTGNKISAQLKRASNVSGKQNEDKSDPSQPLSVQAIKSQNVKTESTNQTDASQSNNVGSTVTDATNTNTGNAVSGTLNNQAQEGQSIHVAASVGVNVTEHSSKTEIKGNLTVGGLKSEVENTGNFSTASTGAAISSVANSNCIGAAVAVSVNGNKAIIEISDNITIAITGSLASGTGKDADPVLGNVALNTVLNQNSTGDALGRYGVLAVSGSSSGKGGKVGLAGSVAVLVAKGTSAIILGNSVTITSSDNGTVSIHAMDKSKLSAAAMAATKSGGSAAGVGASFALLYAKNMVLAKASDNFTVSTKNFSMTATKQAVDITDFEPDKAVSDFITILEVDDKGNGGYETDDADKYGMIVLQKNKNGSYSLFTNLSTADILDLIQLTSILASVNYYASAVAGTVMERQGDTSNQKVAVAGSVSMLFNDSVTHVSVGDNAKITTTGETKLDASSKTNTRLLGGALSSSAAKAGIGVNVATTKQNDKVYITVGNAPVITAARFTMNAESVSDLLVITAAAVNASGTSVGGALNVLINDTGANVIIGNNASIVATNGVEILSNVGSNVILGSVTVSINGSQNVGTSAGAIVSVTTNASSAEAIVGDNAVITSNSGAITIRAINDEQVISVMAASARSGNGGAGAGTISVLTTDAKALAEVGNYAKLTANNDIVINAVSLAKLIDVMLAAAASTDAPAVGATIMVNVLNRDTRAAIGDNAVVISKLGNVLIQADGEETAIIISVAGAAASQNSISGNIQVNVGTSITHATIGSNANIKAWDSIGIVANQNSTVVAISPTVSYGTGSTAMGATVQTDILGSEVKALIGDSATLVAYAQNSVTNGIHTANRESKRKGIILSAFAKDLVVAGGVSASAGKNAAAGVVESLVNKTIVIAKLGTNATVKAGFRSGDSMEGEFSSNTPSDKEGELSAEAEADSTLALFGGAFAATSSTGVGATVLTLVYDQNVEAQILLSTSIPSQVYGNVNVIAKAMNRVALVSVNFGVSNDTTANVGGNVLIFSNKVNAKLTVNLAASGNVTVRADNIVDLINAVASVSGSLAGASISGAALVTYFQGITTASIGTGSVINTFALHVLATSTANIHSDGVGLTASVGSAAVSGLVNIMVTSTITKAYIDNGIIVRANSIAVSATDNYDLLAVAVSLAGGSNGIGATAVVTVAKNTVLAYIGDNTSVNCVTLTLKALSNRNICNYAGSVAAGATAGAGVTVMVAAIGGKLDQDSANGIAKGFKSDVFMNGIKESSSNASKRYLNSINISADLEADDNKASDLHVGDKNGNYSGADDYRSDEFDKQYTSGTNPGENFSDDVTNTQGSELGMAKPEGEYRNVVNAYIGSGCKITVEGATVVEANEKLNIDIVTASTAVGGTAGVNVGVAVVVAFSNVLAEVRNGTVLNCADITVHSVSGSDGSIHNAKASEILAAAGIDAVTAGSSIRVIAITIGIGGTAGVSPSVAVVNMASSAIARMNGISGSGKIITVKAETVYPDVLAVTGAVGAGGTAGISASVAVVTFHSNTYAAITDNELHATELNILSNVDNTAKAYAMSLAGGAVGVNGGVAVVTNRSTTKTVLDGGIYTISGGVNVKSVGNTNADSFIVGLALGGVAVGLNAAVVNQHAIIVTQILGDGESSLIASGNVTVSNDISATAKSSIVSSVGGGVGVGGNVLLVFNNMEAIAAIINMPFNVGSNVTVSAGLNADSQAILNSAIIGGVAVGISTSYVGLNARNQAYLVVPEGTVGTAASIRVYAGNADHKNNFNAGATTVAGGAGIVNVGLNAAVVDIHARNEAKVFSEGRLVCSVDVQANSNAAALAEIYFASAGGINVSAATAVSVLRIEQLAEANIASIDRFSRFNVCASLNEGSNITASHTKLVAVSGGLYNASANVAIAYSLSQNVAQVILHTGTNGGSITVNASGVGDAKSETLNQSAGAFNGSVFVNVAYAKGQFESLLQILDQVSANDASVQTVYSTNSYASLTPSASKLDLSLASFNVNLAIARSAAKTLAVLDGTGKLVLARDLLVKADGSNSNAMADIIGAVVNVSGISFGANVSDSQMALEQTVRVSHINVEAGGGIQIFGNANNLSSTAQTGSNGGVGITIVGSKVNSATADVSAINQILLENVKITANDRVNTEANSNALAVKAIAKALDFTLSGISAAVTATEAKVTRFNTGVFMNDAHISGYQVYTVSYAKGSNVKAQSSVPHFSGSLIGNDSILASATILEKLTQVKVNSGTFLCTVSDLMLNAYAEATLEAGSAHHTTSTSVGAIAVKDYQFTIDVDQIRTEVHFGGRMDVGTNVRFYVNDLITGNITMNDSTIGAFTSATGIAKINVKNQTAAVKITGDITAAMSIIIEAKADQKLSAVVDTSSKDFIGNGYAQTDIILYRNAFVDIDGNLISNGGNITIRALLGTHNASNKVIDLNLKMSVDTWIDVASYPTGTGKLVSVAQVNVAEGSLIQALNFFGDDGFIDIRAKSEGYVQVYVYRYVDKAVGSNSAFAIADVNETVKVNIGGAEKTRILGRDVEIRAFSELDVRSISYALTNVFIGVSDPKAIVIFCVDIDTIIRSAEISAQNYMYIGAYLANTYVLGHSISREEWCGVANKPSVNIKGNVYGDVTFDNNTILRSDQFKVVTFQPAGGDSLTIERFAESYHGETKEKTNEHTVFSTSGEANDHFRKKSWTAFSKKVKFLSGIYDPSSKKENNVYYTGKLTWSEPCVSGESTPSGKTEIYLGSAAIGTYVMIDQNGRVSVYGHRNSDDFVSFQHGIYHIDGSKIPTLLANPGYYSNAFDTRYNDYFIDKNAVSGSLTVLNYSQYDVQLDNVNQPVTKSGSYLNVSQNHADADLIFNGGGNFSNGGIYVVMTGGNLFVKNGAVLNANKIYIFGVGALMDENRTDGRFQIINNPLVNDSHKTIQQPDIHISVENDLDLLIQTDDVTASWMSGDYVYQIGKIFGEDNVKLEVISRNSRDLVVSVGSVRGRGVVSVIVPGNLAGSNSSDIHISGDKIVIQAGGSVGASAPIRIDSQSGVVTKSSGSISLTEVSGNLFVESIVSTGNGDITLKTLDGSILDHEANQDLIKELDSLMFISVELHRQAANINDRIQILREYLQVMKELIEQMAGATAQNEQELLNLGRAKIDILYSTETIEEALSILDSSIIDTEEELLVLGREYTNLIMESVDFVFRANELQNKIVPNGIITGGNVTLNVNAASGEASVGTKDNSLGVSAGGAVSIAAGSKTKLNTVALEGYSDLYLNPVTAAAIMIYALNGVFAVKSVSGTLLKAENLMIRSTMGGDLGTAINPLIMDTERVNLYGRNIAVVNNRSLLVDLILAMEQVYLIVKGDLDYIDSGNVLRGIIASTLNLLVSGDIGMKTEKPTSSQMRMMFAAPRGGQKGMLINVNDEIYISARNACLESTRSMIVASIHSSGNLSINTEGALCMADSDSAIYCNSLDANAFGYAGKEDAQLIIYARNGASVESSLYGENLLIISIVDEQNTDEGQSVGKGRYDQIPNVRVTGGISPDALVTVDFDSSHNNCDVCEYLLMRAIQDVLTYVNIQVDCEVIGQVKVEIPVNGLTEGCEVIVLVCRDGIVYAIRAVIQNGYASFVTDELGAFLVLGENADINITNDGKFIVIDDSGNALPFGGWQ